MRISDWSSDVCSSDLVPRALLWLVQGAARNGVADGARNPAPADGDRLHGLCPAMGPDELLWRQGHHRAIQRYSVCPRTDPDLAPRRLCARQCHAQPLLRSALDRTSTPLNSSHSCPTRMTTSTLTQ